MTKLLTHLLYDLGNELRMQLFARAGERSGDSIIFTDWMISRMQAHSISKGYVLDVLQSGVMQKSRLVQYQYSSQSYLTKKQYPGREIGVFWCYDGDQKILRSCWKRPLYH
ncbi:MAG: hypothetical protein AAF485_20900 [Chloroflexota bacterium]